MTVATAPQVDVETERRDRVAIAAAVAALMGKPVRVDEMVAHPNGRAGAWVREGRLAVQTHRTAPPLARLAREYGEGKR